MGTVWNTDISGNNQANSYKATSTTQPASPAPSMTTTAINSFGAPLESMLAYDNVLKVFKYYNGTAWQTFSAIGALGTMAFQNANAVAITGGTANFGTAASPSADAALMITSTTQGFGLPQLTTTQMNAIPTPRTGLKVFNTTLIQEVVYNGTAWVITG